MPQMCYGPMDGEEADSDIKALITEERMRKIREYELPEEVLHSFGAFVEDMHKEKY